MVADSSCRFLESESYLQTGEKSYKSSQRSKVRSSSVINPGVNGISSENEHHTVKYSLQKSWSQVILIKVLATDNSRSQLTTMTQSAIF